MSIVPDMSYMRDFRDEEFSKEVEEEGMYYKN